MRGLGEEIICRTKESRSEECQIEPDLVIAGFGKAEGREGQARAVGWETMGAAAKMG